MVSRCHIAMLSHSQIAMYVVMCIYMRTHGLLCPPLAVALSDVDNHFLIFFHLHDTNFD